jgi:hypothetical protein
MGLQPTRAAGDEESLYFPDLTTAKILRSAQNNSFVEFSAASKVRPKQFQKTEANYRA